MFSLFSFPLLSKIFLSTALAVTPPEVDNPIKIDGKNKYDTAIVIGNENYYRLPQAIFAQNDAEAIGQFLIMNQNIHKRKIVQLKNVKTEDIQQAIKKMSKKSNKNGTLWFYFAGHGVADVNGHRYILPVDADPTKPKESGIDVETIFDDCSARGNRVVIILDSTFGNTGRDGLPIFDNKNPFEPYAVTNSDPNRVLWVADENQGYSPAYIQAQHSLFTYLILGAFQGWADGELDNTPDGKITMREAQQYVANRTLQLGHNANPSVFDSDDMDTFEIVSEGELKKAPTDALLEELSISLRMRSFANQAELLRAEATTKWNDVLFDVQKGGQQGEDALKRYLDDYEKTSISVDWLVYVPQVSEARRILKDYANAGNIIPFDPEICQDLVELEGNALMGELQKEQIACLEAQLRLERLQTKKSKISTLLINNDFNAKNWASWEYRTRNHLQSIDRSEPDLSFAFSVFLQQKGPEYYKEALKWSNYTLETRNVWPEGDQFVVKSNRLFRLRAELAMEIWIQAEDQYTQERTAELNQIAQESRGLARDLAREWYDYAQKTGRDSKRPFDMCMSATTEPSFCAD